MIRRRITESLERALNRQAAVGLLGPRQVGKTTLALEIGAKRNAIYLDLEDPDDRNKLTSPRLFFEGAEDQLVILDEIHRAPDIFETLRGVIDRGRRSGRGKGRFLILGSAAIEILRQSGETLAGRIAYIDLTGLTVSEIEERREARERLWLRGGFPDAYLAPNDEDSFALRRDFIRTYLERDVPMFGPRVPATTMERLWTMLAHHQGGVLNASNIARSLEISVQSVTRYIDLLCDLLLTRRLPPLSANIGKRLVKSPKVYIRDSGLVHALLGLKTMPDLSGHPVVGTSWEGFVIENLLAAASPGTRASFFRTAAGAEVDLVLEHPGGARWAIEIKRGLSPKLDKGFYTAIADLKPDRAFAVHAGDDSYPIAENIEAISLPALMAILRDEVD